MNTAANLPVNTNENTRARATAQTASTTPMPTTLDAQQKQDTRAYRLGLLVYLLQALHFLFGITAIIGMLVNHTNGQHVKHTFVASHFRWQIISFWILAPAYALVFYQWTRSGLWWPILLVFCIAAYRILRGWWRLLDRKPLGNFW